MKRNAIRKLKDGSRIYVFCVDLWGQPEIANLCFSRYEIGYERQRVARIVREAKWKFRQAIRAIDFQLRAHTVDSERVVVH